MTLNTFFEKFELFADAPDAVARIRELVLDWAVSGKLCHSDSVEWKEGVLGDVIELISGQHLLAHEQNEDRRGIPYLTGPSDFGEKNPIPARWTDQPKVTAEPGDILITVKGSGVGKTNVLVDQPTAISRQLMAIRVTGADPEFVHVVLKRAAEHFQNAKTGIAIPGIGRREVLGLKVVLPPLVEQKRIVAKVDELMALCDRLDAQQQERETRHAALARASLARFADAPTPANLDFLFHSSFSIPPSSLRKSILTLAVQGKLVPQDVESPLGTLESILAEASVNGVSKGPTFDKSATEILRISAGTSRGDFYVNEDDFKHVDLPPDEIGKFQLAPGDLLACRFNGNLHYVGRFSYYRGKSGRVQVNPDKLIRFRIKTESYCPRYVCLAMNAAPTREAIEAMCATTAGNIGLSAGRLKTVKIPIPPLAEQRRIVAKVEQLMALVDALETQLATSRATAANLLSALVAELTGTANDGKVSMPSASTTGRRGRPKKS
jgi:type I restriction enzyme S subunit